MKNVSPDDASGRPTVSISAGRVCGTTADGVRRFLGIPYAAPPVGRRRFDRPAPHPGWADVRDAGSMGATAPQAPYRGALGDLLPTVVVEGDEYLNLNIWAPADAAALPVMVWVHGGSLAHGANALPGYDGSAFARDGVVFVALNYRLASEGFSVLAGAPLNLGLADVLAALRWVRAEIAAFGGDPEQVTVFGESAGSILLGALVAHPEAASLFGRAILQSGMPGALPPEGAGRITRLVAKRLGRAATREAFADVPAAELVAAEQAVTAGGSPMTGGPGFTMAVEADLVPVEPMAALLAGAGSDITLLLGSNTEEYRLWFVPTGMPARVGALLFAGARLKFRIGRRILAAYRANRPGASRGELLGTLVGDLLLRLPINRVADARLDHDASTYVYEFGWRSPVRDLGAAHAMELPFVFDGLATPDWRALTGDAAPQRLADDMHAAWVRFAKTGDPGWEPWDARRPVRVFDHPEVRTVLAPREDERAVWP
ncbi:carboxylesterase family protein (plasmid) [Embleya sp. NBC_00888]|uniref:carboxylesterase/lipase family protein n=1 Tax=Embleya sp. NBC_00888 TaxID=2975960 RepID=UPI002F908070|nr:carboxylesterase family protein [Embleya sp. NBC_00888]